VWRGATNNQVWMSPNNGKPFTIGGTVTFQSPTVGPLGEDGFMVFHSGDDGNIWYTPVVGDGNNSWHMDRRSRQFHESARVRRADGHKFKQSVPGVPRAASVGHLV
jgi:hypothetical protein